MPYLGFIFIMLGCASCSSAKFEVGSCLIVASGDVARVIAIAPDKTWVVSKIETGYLALTYKELEASLDSHNAMQAPTQLCNKMLK